MHLRSRLESNKDALSLIATLVRGRVSTQSMVCQALMLAQWQVHDKPVQRPTGNDLTAQTVIGLKAVGLFQHLAFQFVSIAAPIADLIADPIGPASSITPRQVPQSMRFCPWSASTRCSAPPFSTKVIVHIVASSLSLAGDFDYRLTKVFTA
jgi:hypothetical protein